MSVQAADKIGLDLLLPCIRRPTAFDIGDDRPNLAVVQNRFETGHVAFDSLGRKYLAAEGDVIEQLPVGMLPGVATCVLGRRRVGAIGPLPFPIRFAL